MDLICEKKDNDNNFLLLVNERAMMELQEGENLVRRCQIDLCQPSDAMEVIFKVIIRNDNISINFCSKEAFVVIRKDVREPIEINKDEACRICISGIATIEVGEKIYIKPNQGIYMEDLTAAANYRGIEVIEFEEREVPFAINHEDQIRIQGKIDISFRRKGWDIIEQWD